MQSEPSPPSIDPSSTHVFIPAPQAAVLLGKSLSTVVRHVKSGLLEGEVVQRPQGTAYLVKVERARVEQASMSEQQPSVPESEQASTDHLDPFFHPSNPAAELQRLEPLFSSVGEAWVRPILAQLSEAHAQLAVRSELIGGLKAQLAAVTDASTSQQARVSDLEIELHRERLTTATLQQRIVEYEQWLTALRVREEERNRLVAAQADDGWLKRALSALGKIW